MFNKTYIAGLILTVFLVSCGTMFDISGKGSKTKCLALSTEKLTISCNCSGKQIADIKIYKNENAGDNFRSMMDEVILNPNNNSIVLPINKDTADKYFLQIEVHLTNSHPREYYYIKTAPGDFSEVKKIYARYVSH